MAKLSGLIAVLDETAKYVIDVRDLGPTPVAVKSARALPLIDSKPSFDPETEVLEGPVTVVKSDQVTRTWTVRSLTDQEQAKRAVEGLDPALMKITVDHENRLRALEGKGSPIASADEIVAVASETKL